MSTSMEAQFADALNQLDQVVRPNLPPSVIKVYKAIYSVLLVAAVFNATHLGIRCYRYYRFGTAFWLFRKVRKAKGVYILPSAIPWWSIIGTIYCTSAGACLILRTRTLEEHKPFYNSVYMIGAPFYILGATGFTLTTSFLFSALESLRTLRGPRSRTIFQLPSTLVFHIYEFGLTPIFLVPTFALLGLANSETNRLLHLAEESRGLILEMIKDPSKLLSSGLTLQMLAAQQKSLTDKVMKYVLAFSCIGIIWMVVIIAVFVPLAILLTKTLVSTINIASYNASSNSRSDGKTHKTLVDSGDHFLDQRRQHVLLICHLSFATGYVMCLNGLLMAQTILQFGRPSVWANLSAVQKEWVSTIASQLVSAVFHLIMAATLLFRVALVPEEISTAHRSPTLVKSLQVTSQSHTFADAIRATDTGVELTDFDDKEKELQFVDSIQHAPYKSCDA